MDLGQWLSNQRHKLVPLFDCDEDLVVKIRYVGRQSQPTLARHPEMESAIIGLVEDGLQDDDWKGLIFVMGWGELANFVPLFIGETERHGNKRSINTNIQNIRTNTGMFARWGDKLDYHIGDLSHALFRFKAHGEHKKRYEMWAEMLFRAPGSTQLKEPVFLCIVPWYTYSKGPSGDLCSVKAARLELIELAAEQFSGTLLNATRGDWHV